MPFAPNRWQNRATVLRGLFFGAEMRLWRALKGRLSQGLDGAGWETAKRRQRKALRGDMDAILRTLWEEAKPLYRQFLLEAYTGAGDHLAADLRKIMNPVFSVSPSRSERLQRLIGELNKDFDGQYLRILRSTDDIYMRVIGRAALGAQAEGSTLRQSLQRSLTSFAEHGVSGFEDAAGRAWGMSEYAEMATRAGMMRAALAGYADTALANGQDLVLISDHSDECPLCSPWENKVLSLTGLMEDHPDCDGTLDDARGAGMFHPNCLHTMAIYFPGLTVHGGGDQQTRAENEEGYGNRQRQRYMERQVRAWKRKQTVAIDPLEERRCKAHVDQWQEKLRILTTDTRLPRQYGREGMTLKLSNAARLIPASLSRGLAIGRGTAGIPAAITVGASLNNRQKAMLANLRAFGSSVMIGKKDVSIRDIAALTAYTGDEYAMLTKGNSRQIMRGNPSMVPIYESDAKGLGVDGWRFTAHSHVGAGIESLIPSDGDFKILLSFGGKRSIIVNSQGAFRDFRIK